MEILLIDKSNQGFFHHLAPAEWFSPFDVPGRYRFGVINKTGGRPYTAGILIFDVLPDPEDNCIKADLCYLQVVNDFYRNDTLDTMIAGLFEVLSDTQLKKLVCRFPEGEPYDFFRNRLELRGAQFTQKDGNTYTVPLGELFKNPFFNENEEEKSHVLSLSECYQSSLLHVLEQLQTLPQVPEEIGIYLPLCDPEVSCVLLEDGSITGITLVRKLEEGQLELLLFRSFGKSARSAQDMLLFAGHRAKEHYTPDTLLRLSCRIEAAAPLVAYFLPKVQPQKLYFGVLPLKE